MNKILYVCSEVFPLVKTGGLADVAGSLPLELLKQSNDVRLLLPAYPIVLSKLGETKVVASCDYYHFPTTIFEAKLPGTDLTVWLVDCPAVFNRRGDPYSDLLGQPWHDNALRFTVLCHAAVAVCIDELNLGWKPDLVHCNDWQTGLIPALLSFHQDRPATVFTIHNLAYQGIFDEQIFHDLHLPKSLWHADGVEFYDKFSFIKGGLYYADIITTVSPNYAKEILHHQFSYGLDGLLQHRQKDLYGILNGIDEKVWDPKTDQYLTQNYDSESINQKIINKTNLQQELSLPVSERIPMFGMVSRLVEQKGMEIILANLDILIQQNVQFVILGTGESHYEILLAEAAARHPQNLKVIIGYDEPLAHKIEAASDLYMMPSTFEPCGLNQIYSLRYGTLPLVTPIGGLADTVIDSNDENIQAGTANGFVLAEQSSEAFIASLHRALSLYQQTDTWRQLQLNAMGGDFSWKSSAEKYHNLYQQAISARQ